MYIRYIKIINKYNMIIECNEISPFIGEVGKYYSLITQDFNWSGVNRKWSVQVSPSGVIGISSVCP